MAKADSERGRKTYKAKKYDEVIREGREIRDMYPEYVEAGNVYEFLADAYLAKGNKAAAMAQLERYSAIGGRSPYLLKKLASLQAEAGKKREAAGNALTGCNYIYPVRRRPASALGDCGST